MATKTQALPNNKYDFIDLVKFILSLMIVALHNSLFNEKIYPWVRIAVPLFFAVSAYFLFVKLGKCKNTAEKNSCVKKYVIKNLQLYLFWTVVQLPLTVYTKFDFDVAWYIGILKFIKRILVGKGFTASWFLIATVVAVVLIYFASKKLNNKIILLISMIIYAIVVLESSYTNVVDNLPILDKAFDVYEKLFASAVYSVPAALVWIALGKCFADGNMKIGKIVSVAGTIGFGVCLYFEWYWVYNNYSTYNTDCFFFLVPFCGFLFALILNFKTIHIPAALTLRKLSVIIYTTHGSCGLISKFILKKIYPDAGEFFVYLCIVLCSILCGFIVIKLQKHFKLLKYAL